MASTYSPLLRLEKQGIGENDDTWGSRLNTVIDLIEHALSRRESIALSNSDVTLTANNGAADQARNMCLALSGTITVNINVVVPAASKIYVVTNNCTGAFTVTVKTAAGSGIVIAQGGGPALLFCDGTNVLQFSPTNVNAALLNSLASSAFAEIAQARTITGLWNFTTYPTLEGFSAGFREIPQNSQSAAYGLVLADNGKHIYHPSADTTARIWTIPANASIAYPIGTALTFVNDVSAGIITIAITSDTLVQAGSGATGSRSLAAGGIATAIKMTATRWMISGTGLT